MKIEFTKMQGLGNDFVVIDTLNQPVNMNADLARRIADRHYGVGCDQILLLTKPKHTAADFGYRIFNADGGEVSQCGNGARCMGLFVAHKKLSNKQTIVLETKTGLLTVKKIEAEQFEVSMGVPTFDAASIPFLPDQALPLEMQLTGVVNIGNPHAMVRVETIDLSALIRLGALLNKHPAFPEGVNLSFLQVNAKNDITLSVYERGVGLTKACGSAATAAVAIGREQGWLDTCVTVHQEGGDLSVLFENDEGLLLSGPANVVFDGIFF